MVETEKTERGDKNAQPETEMQEEKIYPPWRQVFPAMVAIYLAVFLVAIDRTIIGTAIPTISAEFNSFGDIAWYEAGFLLPFCVLQLSFGRVYKFYSAKWILTALVGVFEIGSIVCAAAPNSNALIVGRVIAGIGGTGIASGAFLLISQLVPLQSRPKYSGGLGAVFGLASIIGPIMGGYLTSVTWRWCFWINVPIGVISLAFLVFLTPQSPPPDQPAATWRGKILQLDPLGFALIAPCLISLLFAIEFGGTEFAWNSGTIIALFVVFGVFGIAFIASQLWLKDDATVPPQVFLQRSIFVGCIASIGIGSLLVIYSFYLPIWFQVIQGKSPEDSGLSLLPLLLSTVVAVISSGIATSLLGYYTPFFIVGSAISIVGAALITTWQANIGAGVWIGYQIVAGFGTGLILQQPVIAAQTVLSDKEAPLGLSLLNFQSFLGGTIFITVSQNLLESKLISGLKDLIPNLDPASLAGGGATTLRSMVPSENMSRFLDVYNDSIKSIWYLTLALACLVFVASFGLEWKSVKKGKKTEDAEQ